LSYGLKTPWRNGTTHVLFEPVELLEKLAALIPAPRLNLTRFHGVLAPAAKWRASIVPPPPVETTPVCGCRQLEAGKKRRPNYSWAALMARVFEVDVLQCGHCKGRLRILAAIHPPENTRKILECLGLPTRALPLVPAAARSTPNDVD
jgi:Putative transposase